MRYYTTTEIAELWGQSTWYVRYMMLQFGATPLGQDEGTLVWRADDARRVGRILRTSGKERSRNANILRGIIRRRAKREAAQRKGA